MVIGEVDGDAGGAFGGHGRDEDGGAVEVLQVQGQGVGVGGIEEEHGVEERGAVDRLLVEGRVDVVEELVARFDCYLRGFGNSWPEVVFLMGDTGGVVVAVEWIECAQHGPACAELFGGVASVPADVGSDHRDLVDGCECNHFGNRDLEVRPIGVVVAEPVADVAAGACKGAAGYDQGSQAGPAVEHGASTRFAHHGAEEIMGVIFGKAVGVDEIGVKGEIANGVGCVVDGIWRVDEVAVWEAHHGACSSDLSLFEGLPPPYAARGGGLEVCGKPRDWVACVGADWWRCRGVAVGGGESCWVTARVGAEVGGFVHVNPECIDVNAIRWTEETGKLSIPIALSGWIEPVWECGDTRPDDA